MARPGTTPLTPENEIDELLAELAALVEPVELHFLWRPQVLDPKVENGPGSGD
jgi:hypothetical protein